MSRPLRIEFPGAVYHVTSRGDRREPIYKDDEDRHTQLAVLAQAMQRFDAQVLAYCQMGNHYHLVLHTRAGNLSRLMRHVNGVYTQAFNQRHGLVGHLFQGRFKAIQVDRDAYLLALCRYVERNPVAAKMVREAGAWPWSSDLAHVGKAATPSWLDTEGLHGYLLGRTVSTAAQRRKAAAMYAALVSREQDGDAQFWRSGLRGQIYLGDDEFAARMQAMAQSPAATQREIPKRQRMAPRTWAQCLADCGGDRDVALHTAYCRYCLTMTALAQATELSVSRVSRVIAAAEAASSATSRE
jgi:putative transposase